MAESSTNPITIPATEGQPHEADPPIPSWGSGTAPSTPMVDDSEGLSDTDSAIGGMSAVTSTTSLRSSIYEHVEENGRTYHRFRQGKYMLPNDKQEQERLDIQHAMFCISLGKLHLSPIGANPQNVLDIATGTGLWAIEFALQYPSARVLGTDLSAIQPEELPTNCRFEIDDAEDEWIFTEQFDFIHGRALLSCFKDPKSVFQSAYNALKPGGYFEMQDMIFPFHFMGDPPTESALYKWMQLIDEGATKLGRPWHNVPHYKRWFEELGFEDVVEAKYYWPLNAWAKGQYYKEISVYAQTDMLRALEGLSLKVLGSQGWTAEQVRAYLPQVRDDVKNTRIHCYCPIRVVYGRKPVG